MKSFLKVARIGATGFLLLPGKSLYADEIYQKIDICRELQGPQDINGEFDPAAESGKTLLTSRLGTLGGHTLIKGAGSVSGVFILRQAGVVSGRVLVWIFEVGNPLALALGYIFVPTATANCDVPYTRDPDCLNRRPCIVQVQ